MSNSPGPYGLLHLGRGTIGDAVRALNEGKRVASQEWLPEIYFIFKQVPATIGEDIVPNMQSLPQDVKNEFLKRFDDGSAQIDAIYYKDQIACVNESNIIVGWSPTVSDILANDWTIIE